MNLYIVTTGLPGPDPATCGFVELEDETGASVGDASGADWRYHPTSQGLYQLGPFAPAALATAIDRALAILRDDDIDVREAAREVYEVLAQAIGEEA